MIGTPAHDPILHRSARNIEGVQVAPVAEFNTYDVLKQRYLLLTREALDRPQGASQGKAGATPAPAKTTAAAATAGKES